MKDKLLEFKMTRILTLSLVVIMVVPIVFIQSRHEDHVATSESSQLMVDSMSKTVDFLTENKTKGENPDYLIPRTMIQNETKTNQVPDPTGQTDGYNREDLSGEFVELMGSRGKSYRHFYNKTSGSYLFQSDLLAYKENVYEETPWLTKDEYPALYHIRTIDGQIKTFSSSDDANFYLDSMEKNQIWAVTLEHFDGMFGFFLAAQEGHGQYFYWPRLQDGTLPAFRTPLYAIYPRLILTTQTGESLDQVITDKTLIANGSAMIFDTLTFFSQEDKFGLEYTLFDVQLANSSWNMKVGFKYCLNDHRFHLLNDLQCINQNFTDLGLVYEITPSPFNHDSDLQDDLYILSHEQETYDFLNSMTWDFPALFPAFEEKVSVYSTSRNGYDFIFSDMRSTGFSISILNYNIRSLPDGAKKVLQAGMSGLGTVTKGKWIHIDPSIGTVYSTDNYDLYRPCGGLPYRTTEVTMSVGIAGGYPDTSAGYSFVAFDTGINDPITPLITSPSMYLYWSTGDSFEEGEGISLLVYNIVGSGDGADSNTCKEDSTSYSLGTYLQKDKVWGNYSSAGYYPADTTKLTDLLEYWAEHRGDSENWISFNLVGYGMDSFTQDDAHVYDSQ